MFLHPNHVGELYSAFLQDEMTLLPGKLVLTAAPSCCGTRIRILSISRARAALETEPTQSLWASVSRAVRTPSDLDRDVRLDFSDGVVKHLPWKFKSPAIPGSGRKFCAPTRADTASK